MNGAELSKYTRCNVLSQIENYVAEEQRCIIEIGRTTKLYFPGIAFK